MTAEGIEQRERPVQGNALMAELCCVALEKSRREVRRERVSLPGGNVREETMIICVMVNAVCLCFYLVLWGLSHDVLVRLAGLYNTHHKPNTLRDKGQLSDCMYF